MTSASSYPGTGENCCTLPERRGEGRGGGGVMGGGG